MRHAAADEPPSGLPPHEDVPDAGDPSGAGPGPGLAGPAPVKVPGQRAPGTGPQSLTSVTAAPAQPVEIALAAESTESTESAAGPARGAVARARNASGRSTADASPVLAEATPPRSVVERSSVRRQVLGALRDCLAEGELEPGRVYSAPGLAARFRVSATPVREAMQQLLTEGAVEVVPNRGFRIVERGPRELAELAEVRTLLEVPVMLGLARDVSPEQWAALRPQADATVMAAARGDFTAYAESDRAFHRAVLSLSGNEQLVLLAEDLHRRSQRPLTGGRSPMRTGDLVADAAEHAALLDALVARDLVVVESLVREHFAGSGR